MTRPRSGGSDDREVTEAHVGPAGAGLDLAQMDFGGLLAKPVQLLQVLGFQGLEGPDAPALRWVYDLDGEARSTGRRIDMTERPRVEAAMTERPTTMTERPDDCSARADVLSDVLRAVRLRGAVFYSVSASTPGRRGARRHASSRTYVMPGSEHVIEYHLLRRWGVLGRP